MITLLFKFIKFYLVTESNTVHRIAGYFSAGFSPVSRKVVFGFFFFLMFTKRFAFFQFCLIGLIAMFTTVEDCYVS